MRALANDKLEELKNEEGGLPPAKRAKKQADATTSTTADAANAKAKKRATDAAKKARSEATKVDKAAKMARSKATRLDKAATKAEAAAEKARLLTDLVPLHGKGEASRDAERLEAEARDKRQEAELADIEAIALEGEAAGLAADSDEEVLDQGVVA